MNDERKQLMLIATAVIIMVGLTAFVLVNTYAEIVELETKVKYLQDELSSGDTAIYQLVDACVQSSQDMNAAYNLLKKQYESLSIEYYASDDDYLIKENEILRKELALYQQTEKR